jgi:hypothetical protein
MVFYNFNWSWLITTKSHIRQLKQNEKQKNEKNKYPRVFFSQKCCAKIEFSKMGFEILHFFGCDENRHKMKKTPLKMTL